MKRPENLDMTRIKTQFVQRFGEANRDIRVFFAPGRVNMIGEHTDYNGGYVFPAALTFGTWALVRPREDNVFRFASTHFHNQVSCHVSEVVYKPEDGWGNYPKGILHELLTLAGRDTKTQTAQALKQLSGADILFHGNIPNGAGLSSSASIELVTALALTQLASANISMLELVQLSQRAENNFVGVNCGIMDQFAVGMGKENHVILLNCQTLTYEYVPLVMDGYKVVITHTNKRRDLIDSKYNERRSECEQGLKQIQKQWPHIQNLGAMQYDQWQKVRPTISSDVIRNRVAHVVSENARVHEAADCLRRHDLAKFGQLMIQSHESLRDLYEVTGPELDTLFAAGKQVPGCIGTRMTGAGFGGCTVSLVRVDSLDAFKQSVATRYTEKIGLTPTFYVCEIGDGAREIGPGGD